MSAAAVEVRRWEEHGYDLVHVRTGGATLDAERIDAAAKELGEVVATCSRFVLLYDLTTPPPALSFSTMWGACAAGSALSSRFPASAHAASVVVCPDDATRAAVAQLQQLLSQGCSSAPLLFEATLEDARGRARAVAIGSAPPGPEWKRS